VPPRRIIGVRDGIRQAVADLMQLVRVIEMGMDVDGDMRADLNPARIYHVGISRGGEVSMVFMAVEPSVRAAVFISPGGLSPETVRLSPENLAQAQFGREQLGRQLASRIPSLINAPGITSIGGIPVAQPHFNENRPLKNQLPVTKKSSENNYSGGGAHGP
jgi:pimeloyl-ACP methyl ester carboxylesterase